MVLSAIYNAKPGFMHKREETAGPIRVGKKVAVARLQTVPHPLESRDLATVLCSEKESRERNRRWRGVEGWNRERERVV